MTGLASCVGHITETGGGEKGTTTGVDPVEREQGLSAGRGSMGAGLAR